MDSGFILRHLQVKFDHNSYNIKEAFVYGEESDFLTINRDGYAHELEVKISRGDFRADFKKSKHTTIPNFMSGMTMRTIRGSEMYNKCELHWYSDFEGGIKYRERPRPARSRLGGNWQTSIYFQKVTCKNLPNKFSFCVPEGLVQKDEVPDYAGLYWIDKNGTFKEKKRAKFIHKEVFSRYAILATKYYYRGLNQLETIEILRDQVKYWKEKHDQFNGQLNL